MFTKNSDSHKIKYKANFDNVFILHLVLKQEFKFETRANMNI